DPTRPSHAARAVLVGRAGAERDVEVKATDGTAEPTHFSVRERPDQVPHEQLHRHILTARDLRQVLLAIVDRLQKTERAVRAQVRGLQAQILGEMKGVSSTEGGAAVAQIRGVPAAQSRKLVAQCLLEDARDHAAIGAAPDELLLELLV